MTGTHRSGMARRRLVAVVLAAALGRGYVGRHRLAAAALGRSVTTTAPVALTAPMTAPSVPAPTSRQSVAPRLSVVRTPRPNDVAVDAVLTATILADVLLGDTHLRDTKPHPVVTPLPLPAPSRDDAVYAVVDAERDAQVTAELAGGPDVRLDERGYLARHRPRRTA